MKRAIVASAFAIVSIARAESAPNEAAPIARSYFLAGQAAYSAGDYAAAALALEQASAALPDPRTTFSLAQAYRQLYLAGHDPAYAARAVELYKSYLHELPQGGRSDDAREFAASLETLVELAQFRGGAAISARSVAPHTQLMVWSTVTGAHAAVDGGAPAAVPVVIDAHPGPHKVDLIADGYDPAHFDVVAVDGRLVAVEGQLHAKPGTIQIKVPSDAQISVDEVDVVDSGHGIAVPPGHHRVWIGERGHVAAHSEIDLAPGGTKSLTFTLETSPRRRNARAVLIGAGAVAVIALGTFGYAAWESHHAQDLLTIRDTQAWSVAQGADYASSRDSALRWSDVSIGIAIGAAAVAGIGAYLYYADVPSAPRRTVLTPMIDAAGGGVSLAGRF